MTKYSLATLVGPAYDMDRVRARVWDEPAAYAFLVSNPSAVSSTVIMHGLTTLVRYDPQDQFCTIVDVNDLIEKTAVQFLLGIFDKVDQEIPCGWLTKEQRDQIDRLKARVVKDAANAHV